MIIKITNKHIKAGVKNDNNSCPIALAIKEHGFSGKNPCCTITNADESKCIDFMRDFDSGKPVQPFSFKVAPMPHNLIGLGKRFRT